VLLPSSGTKISDPDTAIPLGTFNTAETSVLEPTGVPDVVYSVIASLP